jgi:hypothetical protein
MVRPDAHRDSTRLALQHQRREALLDPPKLGRVVPVRVVAHSKQLLVREIARVDTHLVHVLGCL